MAAESRNSSSALTGQTSIKSMNEPSSRIFARLLDEEPFRVHFFQAVRMLQRMDQELRPVGYFVTPKGETIRFSAKTSLALSAQRDLLNCSASKMDR